MPDQLTPDGLQVKTLPEIRAEMVAALKEIYGEDINVDQNTPDGQFVNIFAQAAIDTRELLQKAYSSFDVYQAQGRVLDQRVALGGVKRKGASFNFTVVEVEVDREVRLQGLDAQRGELTPSIPNLYTVKDDSGLEYYLLNSVTLGTPETVVASEEGEPEESLEDKLSRLKEERVQLNTKISDLEASKTELEAAEQTDEILAQLTANSELLVEDRAQLQALSTEIYELELAIQTLQEASETFEQWKARKKVAQLQYDKKVTEYTSQVNVVVNTPGWYQKSQEELESRETWTEEEKAQSPLEFQLPPPVEVPEILYTTPEEFRDEEIAGETEEETPPPQEVTTEHSLLFRAARIGRLGTLANTVTEAVTIIAGVVKVNNRTKSQIEGVDEETDEKLKARFSQSASLPAQGYIGSIEARIRALPKVDLARVYENSTDSDLSDGQSPHSIWVIVKGTPDSADDAALKGRRESITDILYRNRPAGTSMYSVEKVTVDGQEHRIRETDKIRMPNGKYFHAYWNRTVDQKLLIQLTVDYRDLYSDTNTSDTFPKENLNKLIQSFQGKDGGKRLEWGLGLNASPDDVHRFVGEKHPEYQVYDVQFFQDGAWSTKLIQPRKYVTLVFSRSGSVINGHLLTEEERIPENDPETEEDTDTTEEDTGEGEGE